MFVLFLGQFTQIGRTTFFIQVGDVSYGYIVKLTKQKDTIAAFRAATKDKHLNREEQIFFSARTANKRLPTRGYSVIEDIEHNELIENVSIHHQGTLTTYVGAPLETGNELMNGCHFFYHDGYLRYVKSVERKPSAYCPKCLHYYFQKCNVCGDGVEIDEKTGQFFIISGAEDADAAKWTKLDPIKEEHEDAVIIRYCYDVETATMRDDHFMDDMFIYQVCVQFDVILISHKIGYKQLYAHAHGPEGILVTKIFKKIREIMTDMGFEEIMHKDYANGIEYTGIDYGVITSPNETIQFNMFLRPLDTMIRAGVPAARVVTSQIEIYNWIGSEAWFKPTLVEFWDTYVGDGPISIMLTSNAYNGGKFDEVFLLRYRMFAESVIPNTSYQLKSGRIMRMDKSKYLSKINERRIVVTFRLFDICAFWTAPLRKVAKDLKLPVQKGDMDFDIINGFYNGGYGDRDKPRSHVNTTDIDEDWVHSWTPYYGEGHEEAWEEVQKYKRDGKFDLKELSTHYCMRDVIVMRLAENMMQNMVSTISSSMVGFHLNIFKRIGTPGISKAMLIAFMHANDIQIDVPQEDLYDVINVTKMGGRSEIGVLGVVEREMAFLDINSMYGTCMTAPFPIGIGVRATTCHFLLFEEFLERAKNYGWRKSVRECYPEVSTDYGFLFAYVDLIAPPKEKLYGFAHIAYRSKEGLIWSNESRECQPMTSIDMEYMARLGWTVKICRTMTAVYFEKGFSEIASLVQGYMQRRIKTTEPALKTVLKLLANAMYGKFLENLHDSQFEVFCEEHIDQRTKNLKNYGEFTSGVRENRGKLETYRVELICKLKNPYNEPYYNGNRPNDPMNLYVGKVSTSGAMRNRTPVQWGTCVLSYSKGMVTDVLVLSEFQMHLALEDRLPAFFASETDSIHIPKERFDHVPPELLNDKEVGGWNEELKFFNYFLKLEEYSDGEPIISKKQAYLMKKFYFVFPNKPENQDPKYACKGIAKAEFSERVIELVFRGYKYIAADNEITFVRTNRYKATMDVFVKDLPGVRSYHQFHPNSGVKAKTLERLIAPKNSSRRIVQGTEDVVLGQGYICMLPFDDEHKNPIPYEPELFKRWYSVACDDLVGNTFYELDDQHPDLQILL